jgi:aspartyl-tRNA(Asn)/glutamyl-tRNA(Gln) amidotransferase subunit A
MIDRTARQLRDDVTAGRVSATEVCTAFLERIDSVNPALNAFNTVTREHALDRARALDAARQAGTTLGPLAGVPIALKDNLCVRGMRTTASSRILDQYVPPYTATAVA